MAARVRICDLRLALVWTLGLGVEEEGSLLGNYERYLEHFEQARQGKGNLRLPWQTGKHQHFWEYHLEVMDLAQVTSKNAWRHLLPLRTTSLVDLTSPPDTAVNVEGLIYPHAIAVLIMLGVRKDLALYPMVDAMVALRNDQYPVHWHGDPADDARSAVSRKKTLDQIASEMLSRLYHLALGKSAAFPPETIKPYTIASAVDGSGVPLYDENKPKSEVHRALEGLCLLNTHWKKKKTLHDWDQATHFRFKGRNAYPDADIVYVVENGRAIWLPVHFTENQGNPGKIIPKNSCYHRNLAHATAQTASMLAFLRQAEDYIEASGERLSQSTDSMIDYATNMLGRMSGHGNAYQSWSIKQQIRQAHEHVDYVRSQYGKSKLFERRPKAGSENMEISFSS